MSAKTATIIGVTGLVGGHLYELLKEDKRFETVRLIVRRPMPANDPRTEVKLVDFNDAESLLLGIEGSDVVFCAVGTTNKKVKGDKEVYRNVDYDIPVKAARFCKMRGCETFVLVSAIGANSKSRNFYLKLKGEVEEAIKEAGLRSVHIMQPSVLLGNRSEKRSGEKIGATVLKILSPVFAGGLRKYRPVTARDVAKAMLEAAKADKEGFFVYAYDEIKESARRNPAI